MFRRIASWRVRAVLIALGIFGAWAGLYGVSHPGRYYSGKHVLRYASPLCNRISEFLPGFVAPSPGPVVPVLLTLAAAVGLTVYLRCGIMGRETTRSPVELPVARNIGSTTGGRGDRAARSARERQAP